jgi:hypothetical protein
MRAAMALTNLYLDHFLDRPWRRDHPDLSLLRFVDDLLVLCRPGEDSATKICDDLENLLAPTGLSLKRSPMEAICNLDHQSCVWLGYELSLDERGRAVVRPARSLGELRESLMRAHAEDNSSARAEQGISGIIDYAGPCYPFCDRKAIYKDVWDASAEMAFEEIVPERRLFCHHWKRAFERWSKVADQHGYFVRRPRWKRRRRSAMRSATPS